MGAPQLEPTTSATVAARARALAVAAAASAALGLLAGAGPAEAATYTAYIANRSSNTVTPINTATNTAGSQITVGGAPTGIAITPDAKTAYVVNSGSNTVTPIALATTTTGSEIQLGGSIPLDIAIAPDGKTAYVVNSASDNVTPVTLATNKAGTPIAVGSGPVTIAITPDGKTAYVVNSASNTVTPITLATNKAGTPIAVGKGPIAIAITPDGRTVYVCNFSAESVTPITVATNTAGSAITVGAGPEDVAITADGSAAYVTNHNSNTVTPISTATNSTGTPIAVGAGPTGLAITPDGRTAYVSNGGAKTVSRIALATSTVGPAIAVGGEPLGAAITPDQAPVASFTVKPGASGSASSFDASASTVAYGSITNYRWSFGDGESAETGTPTTNHTYAAAGQYTATLTETDSAGTSTTQLFTGQTMSRSGGESAQSTRAVTVNSAPRLTTQPSSTMVTAPYEASFAVACSGSPAPTLQWQLSSDRGVTWSEIPGQTSRTLSISPTKSTQSGNQYRAVCTNVAGSQASSAATLSVNSAMTPSVTSAVAHAASHAGISGRPVTVTRRGDAVIALSCPASALGGCSGIVTLKLFEAHGRHARAVAARCARGCRPLGSARYQARAGQKIRVRVHISSAGQKLLAKRNAVRVSVIVTNVAGGHASTTIQRITLNRRTRRA